MESSHLILASILGSLFNSSLLMFFILRSNRPSIMFLWTMHKLWWSSWLRPGSTSATAEQANRSTIIFCNCILNWQNLLPSPGHRTSQLVLQAGKNQLLHLSSLTLPVRIKTKNKTKTLLVVLDLHLSVIQNTVPHAYGRAANVPAMATWLPTHLLDKTHPGKGIRWWLRYFSLATHLAGSPNWVPNSWLSLCCFQAFGVLSLKIKDCTC